MELKISMLSEKKFSLYKEKKHCTFSSNMESDYVCRVSMKRIHKGGFWEEEKDQWEKGREDKGRARGHMSKTHDCMTQDKS